MTTCGPTRRKTRERGRGPILVPYLPRWRGTLLPARRASDKPIAIACLRLLTRLPERPLRSLPRFISRTARRTLLPLARLYLRAIVVTCWFHRDCVPYLRRSLTRSLRNSCRCAIANRVGWVSRLSDSSH